MTAPLSGAATGLPENAAAAAAMLAEGRPALVWRRIIADSDTPVGAARRLIVPGRGDFLLESVEGGEVRGRYSLLGLDPDLVFRASGNEAAINRDWRLDREAFVPCAGDALAELRALAAACRIDPACATARNSRRNLESSASISLRSARPAAPRIPRLAAGWHR